MTTPAPPRTRRLWQAKLARLAAERTAAEENLLVGIFIARQEGVSQQVIADAIEGLSASGVQAKARKGEEIVRSRKGSGTQ